MKILKTTTLFEDPDARSPLHNAAFASLLDCGGGTILLAHRAGTDKTSADGNLLLWRSRDHGQTWRRLGHPFPAPPGEFRPAGLTRLDDTGQRLVMLLTWIDHFDPQLPIFNDRTEGLMPVQIGLATSTDGGDTWSPIRAIPVAPAVQPCGNGSIVVLPDGAWLVAFETYKHWDDAAPWSASSYVVISRDQGNTWSAPITVARDPECQRSFWDHHVNCLRDGTLVGALWSDDRQRPGESDVLVTRSIDGGRTWEAPRAMNVGGQFAEITELRDGRLLMTYVRRKGEPSIRLRFGGSDGQAWDARDAMVIYSQQHDDLLGVRGDYDDYLRSMATWSFGWPATLELEDGTLLVAYYTGRASFAGLRLSRISLGPSASVRVSPAAAATVARPAYVK